MGFSRRAMAQACFSLLVIPMALGLGDALALPKEGGAAPNARIEDSEGAGLELKTLKGKPVVIVYDDRASAPTSEAYRKELVKLLKSAPFASNVKLLVVADVSPYDFWPARGTVKDAVRDETKKQGTTVYCDWTGGIRLGFKLKKEVTSVLMIDKDGNVAFAFEGIPGASDKQRLEKALRANIGG